MNIVLRFVITLLSFVATFYFVYWMSLLPAFIDLMVSLVAAAGVAFYVWRHTRESRQSLISSILVGALITGTIGFVVGFFGPILFTPGANQGPLLGLFITGPIGLVLGAIGGAIYWNTWIRPGSSQSV